MEAVLIVITLVSVVLAALTGLAAWRMHDEERRRSEARVTALMAELGQYAPEESTHVRSAPLQKNAWAPQNTSAAQDSSAAQSTSVALSSPTLAESELLLEDARFADAVAGSPGGFLRDTETANVASDDHRMFAQVDEPQRAGTMGRRLAAVGIGTALMMAIGSVFAVGGRSGMSSEPKASVAAPATPLELVSLSHQRRGADLVVTGLVRNPPAGTEMSNVAAVVLFFDRSGSFVTSVRAPLDFRLLGPGDESPFQIAVPSPGAVARYRISFRRDEGGVVPHVDRRVRDAAAPDRRSSVNLRQAGV